MQKVISLIIFVLYAYLCQAQHLKPINEGSQVHFVIKNFGISTGGDFTGLEGVIVFDPASLKQSFFNVTVKTNSVDTDNERRDSNLRDPEYFDAGNHPELRLVSTKIDPTNKTSAGYYYFTGNLIIKGISKPIKFPFLAEKTDDGYLFTGDFSINRLDFKVGEKSTVLGDNVEVSLKVNAR